MSVQARLLIHACDQSDLDDEVPCYKSRSRLLLKMVRRRLAYVAPIQSWDLAGGPRKVYCRRKVNTPSHDNLLTKVFKALNWPECERGRMLKDVHGIHPDARTPCPRERFWEMDTGTEGYEEIRKKVEAYRQQQSAVLFVCPTDARRNKLIRWTEEIHGIAFFALWADLITTPHKDIWASIQVEKEEEKAGEEKPKPKRMMVWTELAFE